MCYAWVPAGAKQSGGLSISFTVAEGLFVAVSPYCNVQHVAHGAFHAVVRIENIVAVVGLFCPSAERPCGYPAHLHVAFFQTVHHVLLAHELVIVPANKRYEPVAPYWQGEFAVFKVVSP